MGIWEARARRQARSLDELRGRIVASGLFTTSDPAWEDAIFAAMVGAGAGLGLGGMSVAPLTDAVTGWLTAEDAQRAEAPHRVLAVVTDDALRLYVTNAFGHVGPYVAAWRRGVVTSHVRRFPFEVDLQLRASDGKALTLKRKRRLLPDSSRAAVKAISRFAPDVARGPSG